MVVPFAQCVARPDEGETRHLLIHHLVRVANAAGAPDGSTNDRLAFLAGLLHDAAKCHVEWQEYIDPTTSRKKGPPHSPMGAALFTFAAERLIPIWHSDRQERLVARDRMLNWLMAINGHHGRLGDFHGMSLPWMKILSRYSVRNLAAGCDLAGVFELVQRSFPEFQAVAEEFTDWLDDFDRSWVKLVVNIRPKVLERNTPHELAMRFPLDVSRLIIADRIDAGSLADDYLQQPAAVEAIKSHSLYCNQQATEAIVKGASPEMVELRSTIQHDALGKYRECPRDRFFTLLLPTGYGKTLTSLRIALESVVVGVSKRIIYVAPYLSILSQAANQLATATRIDVFQHHHLSLAAMASNGVEATDDGQAAFSSDSDDDFEILDTWKFPILATTFNQFFRALFPARAQHTLRIDAVRKSFIIIDEPQIIDIGVWNLFLRALSVF
ncbi:MAG: CRISPR-associated endonuclease Cas3'', partial [Candidatus Paceibacterota bacterium]